MSRCCTSCHSLALRRSDTSWQQSPWGAEASPGGAPTRSRSVSVCESNATRHTFQIALGSYAASCELCSDTARRPASPHASSTSSAESAHMSYTLRYSVSVQRRFRIGMRIANWSRDTFATARATPAASAHQIIEQYLEYCTFLREVQF